MYSSYTSTCCKDMYNVDELHLRTKLAVCIFYIGESAVIVWEGREL